MEVEIRTGNFGDWYKKAAEVANVADSRKRTNLKSSKYTLILESEDDVNDAYASAFLHRYYPVSGVANNTFKNPNTDPLYGFSEENIKKISSGLTDMDEPWVRRLKEGGVDTIGTFAIDPVERVVIFLLMLRLPMEHLAFLNTWIGNPLEIKITDANKILYRFIRKIKLNKFQDKFQELGTYITIEQTESSKLDIAKKIMEDGGKVLFATPDTVNSHFALIGAKDLLNIPGMSFEELELDYQVINNHKKVSFNNDIKSIKWDNIVTLPFTHQKQNLVTAHGN
ncbi:MAG: hypothetical protein M1576_00240 [Deltaproteobacteria bacterium]|nr:hypothetical protein [Deltaproteobacteria bacterium]